MNRRLVDTSQVRFTVSKPAVDPVPTPALLDTLPVTNLDLARLPDLQALALFDAFRLEIHYDRPGNCARCRVTLIADSLRSVLDATGEAIHLRGGVHFGHRGSPARPLRSPAELRPAR